MKWVLIIVLLTLLALFIPIKLKSKINYNFLKNDGFISIFFYNLKVLVGNWTIVPFKIMIKRKQKKPISIYFSELKSQIDYNDIFFNQMLKLIKIKTFKMFANFGFYQNCLLSSVGCGSLMSIGGIISSYFMNNNRDLKITSQIFPDYKENSFIVVFTSSIKLNFFIIIYCLISSLVIKFNKGN